MARSDEHILDKIAHRLLCSKSRFRTYFSVLEVDGRKFIVEHAFMEFLAKKNTQLRAEESRIIIPAGVRL